MSGSSEVTVELDRIMPMICAPMAIEVALTTAARPVASLVWFSGTDSMIRLGMPAYIMLKPKAHSTISDPTTQRS
ncbi:hypothetical protein D9M68_994990 [compost metagenome]